MRTFYDSVNALGIPSTATMMAGYIDHGGSHYPDDKGLSYVGMKMRFPQGKVLSISTTGKPADILDCERGAIDPHNKSAIVNWTENAWRADRAPWLYTSLGNWPLLRSYFKIQPLWWLAHWGAPPVIPNGAQALQYTGVPGQYDQSVMLDYVPGFDPVPVPPQTTKGKAMFILLGGPVIGDWLLGPDYAYHVQQPATVSASPLPKWTVEDDGDAKNIINEAKTGSI